MLRNTFSVMRNADSDAVFSVFFKFIKDCFKLYFFTDVLEFLRRQYPANNVLEIDRFTEELLEDNVCFLYGDTYYSEFALKTIIKTKADPMMFFGNDRSIIAVKVGSGEVFKKHFDRIKELFLAGKISRCVGWQIYESFTGGPLESRQISGSFIKIYDGSRDFNTPDDFQKSRDL